MLLRHLISGAVSLVSLLAAVLLARRFWRETGAWSVLVFYAAAVVGFDAVSWGLWALSIPNSHLLVLGDFLLQGVATLFLIRLSARLGHRRAMLGISLCFLPVLALALLCHLGLPALRSLGGVMTFLGSLVTVTFLYRWEHEPPVGLWHCAEFWAVCALLSYYASQAALANWMHLTTRNGGHPTIGLVYVVYYLPQLISSFYLILASRSCSYV